MNKLELMMNRSLLTLIVLLCVLLGVAGREAEAAGPPIAPRRAGELIVRFRPGAAPAAPALEAPAAATSGKPASPREAFAFTPAAKLSNPRRPASLKALDQRFGLREARPLGVPARPRASKKNQASPLSSNQAGPLSSNQGAPLSLAPRFNAAATPTTAPSNRFNGFSRPDNAAPASATPASASPAASSSNTAAPLAAPLAETWLLRLDPAADLNAALAAYRADPAVLYAEPNYEGALAFVPSDPLYSQESKNFKLIGLERAWDVRPGASRGVEVAVIDSGIDAAHPDLAGALDLAGSYNFAENNTRIYDDIGHGTRVAGVIGATAANGEGIAGVAFGCRLMSLDVATSAGVITTANVASAIDWAVAKGADVINLSLTFSAFSQPLSDACQAAMASGVVVVAAAGNENQGERAVYPASYSGVLGVGAVSADGRRAPWSNYNGTCAGLVDLVAPGEAVFSTIPNGQYNGSYGSGTSFATPMVSGVAALLKTRYPAQSGQAIAAHLLATAAPVSAAFDPPNGAGSGLLSAQNALATAMQPELALGPVTVDDTSTATAANDGNGRLARGEKATLRVKLKNSGADLNLISAVLTTTDPAITIGDGAGTWGAIKNGEEAGPSDPFVNITVSPTAAAHSASFKLTVWARYNQTALRSQAFTFELPVEAARTVATGNYFTPQTWTADQTWEIQGTQNFNAGLTIQPGTTVKIASGVDININGGALKAEGTADRPILVTGMQDVYWNRIYLKSAAVNSSLRYCTFEHGYGVLNESTFSTFSQCIFQHNRANGLLSNSSAGVITSCTAIDNTGDGIQAINQTLHGCTGLNNKSRGLVADRLFGCRAENNVLVGIKASYATDCVALNNGATGIMVTQEVLRCRAEGNGSTGIWGITVKQSEAIKNKSVGIYGSADQCYVYGNGGGGIDNARMGGRNVTGCQVISNTGFGIRNTNTLTHCLIRDNTEAAVIDSTNVEGCTITGNGSGTFVSAMLSNSYISSNNSHGVWGGAVQNSTIVGNQGRGLIYPLSVTNSWVIYNTDTGVDTPNGDINNSSICYNGGYGILNLAGGKLVNNCNIYGSGVYEVYTNLNTAGGGYPANTLDFRHNYWGPGTTPLLTANPFPSVNIARIFDLFDNNLAKGWYINYGAQGEFETAYLATAPGDKAPAFLLNVSPDAAHLLNIGPATFTLTFSRAMNTTVPLSVTFGTAAPYATNVVAPAPGWVSPVQWQGSFAVQSDTAQGRNTLRVAGAVDATGFAIPDDTAHPFVIETSGKPSANNGLAIGHGIKMALSWSEEDKPATAAGYNVLRSESGLPGTYVKCNGALVTAPAFIDNGLKPYTDYFYMIYIVDSGMNAVQWTPPFLGNTGEERAAVRDWEHYR